MTLMNSGFVLIKYFHRQRRKFNFHIMVEGPPIFCLLFFFLAFMNSSFFKGIDSAINDFVIER